MKTFGELSQRTRNRYILLAKLGIPLQLKYKTKYVRFSQYGWWENHKLLAWMTSPEPNNTPHEGVYVRRKPREAKVK